MEEPRLPTVMRPLASRVRVRAVTASARSSRMPNILGDSTAGAKKRRIRKPLTTVYLLHGAKPNKKKKRRRRRKEKKEEKRRRKRKNKKEKEEKEKNKKKNKKEKEEKRRRRRKK